MEFKIIDISKDLITTEPYPGDPSPELTVFSSFSAGDGCNMAKLSTTLHCGTHADAPLHFIPDGKTINSISLEKFVGECVVLEVDTDRITGDYVDRFFPKSAKRILIKSGGKAYFDKTGAEELSFIGCELVGTDSMSVGSVEDQTGPHRALLGEDVAVLENLDLSQVSPGKYFLVAFPVKIAGVEAAPVRAVLLDGYVFWSN
ncbi:MAG: cyclase family protein [Clostridia bacterium]|nr:cyclase family protein [Clostridia bacterium]